MFSGLVRGLSNEFLHFFFSEGHSCKLLTKNMGLLVINEDTLDVSIEMEVYVYLKKQLHVTICNASSEKRWNTRQLMHRFSPPVHEKHVT